MNFYEDEATSADQFLQAALSLIEHNIEVVPLQQGTKEPTSNIKSLSSLRQNPINNFNAGFFFDRDNAEIAIMLRRKMEVIDVDSKNKEGLSEQFLKGLKDGWPELYDRLVISRTPTGGLHVLYHAEQVGGEVVLAKIHTSRNPLGIIERLSEANKNYIKCAPSAGYEFIRGNPMTMPTLTVEERAWLSAYSASFNEVVIPEVKGVEAERKDSPWSVFNSQNNWQYTLQELKDRNWESVIETDDFIRVRMPAGKQHSGVIWKSTNILHIYTTNSEFEAGKSYTPFGVYCFYYHDNNVGAACRTLASEGIGVDIFDEGQFWKKKGKKVEVKYTVLQHWLHSIGYRMHEGQIVKITHNTVEMMTERDLRALFLKEVEPLMVDHFYEKVSAMFNETGGLLANLQPLEGHFIDDTKDTTWLFFSNYAVKVTATDIETIRYKHLDGLVWKNAIMNRPYYENKPARCSNCSKDECCDECAAANQSDAEKFVRILGGDSYEQLEKIIGYTVSRYKDPSNPRVVVITEDIEAGEEGESQGGSGKGLLVNLCRQFRTVASIDGKGFDPDGQFTFQNVELDTSILYIDDAKRRFKFDRLFNLATGDFPVNKKNKPQIIIPAERAPKIVITSNYSVGEMNESTQRRKFEFPVVKHFGIDLQPVDIFKRHFFYEWDAEEWVRFDNYIISCCASYLAETDKKSISRITANSRERALSSNTNASFVEYMDDQLDCSFFDFAPNVLKVFKGVRADGIYTTNGVDIELMQQHLNDPDYYLTMTKADLLTKAKALTSNNSLTQTKVTQWLLAWGKTRGVDINKKYQRSDGQLCYRIVQFIPAEPVKPEAPVVPEPVKPEANIEDKNLIQGTIYYNGTEYPEF